MTIPTLRPDGPLLVFGGPYSNLQALKAIWDEVRRLGLPPEAVLCTGDVVAYAADPLGCVDLVRDWGIAVLAGNVEEQLGDGADDCACGYDEGSACDALSARWYAHANAAMTPAARAWMRGLPRRMVVEIAGRRLAVLHGGAGAINRFLFPSAPDADLAAETDLAAAQVGGCDGVIAGHSGMPFTRVLPDGRLWHNAGVIGMPPDDGTPRVWYALLTPAGFDLNVEHRALSYDHAAAAAAMRAARLPEGYAACLETGLWPTEDTLPAQERTIRGRRRDPAPVRWSGLAGRPVAGETGRS